MSASSPAEFEPNPAGDVRCFVCEGWGVYIRGVRKPGPEEMYSFGLAGDPLPLYLHRCCLEGPHGPVLDVLYLRRTAEVLFDRAGRNIWW